MTIDAKCDSNFHEKPRVVFKLLPGLLLIASSFANSDRSGQNPRQNSSPLTAYRLVLLCTVPLNSPNLRFCCCAPYHLVRSGPSIHATESNSVIRLTPSFLRRALVVNISSFKHSFQLSMLSQHGFQLQLVAASSGCELLFARSGNAHNRSQ